ncbi:MAG: ankyrin repeat domain-containing protein [Verrucomicrobia bacterium]|nr:ankyrin repeat domain-containing protein [Verrucomicrobiota bacterium]
MSGFISGLKNAANNFMQEAPITHESLKKDMESYIVTENSILERVKRYVTSENINNGIGTDNNSLQTLLTAAIANKRYAVAQWLVEQGANVNMGTQNGGFPVVLAAKHGNFDLIKVMMAQGATLASCSDFIATALAANIDSQTLKFFIQNGAGFSVNDILSALHNEKILTVLLQNLPAGSLKGFNAKFIAEKNVDLISLMLGKKWFNIINLLCDAGIDLTQQNHIALINSGRIDVVRYCITKGVFNVNAGANSAEQTPLMAAIQLAVKNPNIGYEMVDLLLQKGANVNAKSQAVVTKINVKEQGKAGVTEQEVLVGRTPLLEAVHQGNKDLVELLCKKGANLEITEVPGEQGHTPLQIAVRDAKLEIIRTLVLNGANVNVKTQLNTNLLHEVTNVDIVRYLASRGINMFHTNSGKFQEYPITQLMMHEAKTKGKKEVYDDILEPVFREQMDHVHSFIGTLNAKQNSRQTVSSFLVGNRAIDLSAAFAQEEAHMRQMGYLLSVIQKPEYQTHLATKSKEFQQLVTDMEEVFTDLVTHPEFSAFINEMAANQNAEAFESIKSISAWLIPATTKYNKQNDPTSIAVTQVEQKISMAIMNMSRNKTFWAPQTTTIKSDLTGLYGNHEQRSAGIALMTSQLFVEEFNQAIADKNEAKLKEISAQMKPFEAFFEGQGDQTAKAIHQMYVQMQQAFDDIQYQRDGFFKTMANRLVSTTTEEVPVTTTTTTVTTQGLAVESHQEVSVTSTPVIETVVVNEPSNPSRDKQHGEAVAKFTKQLSTKDGSLSLEAEMRNYLSSMKGLMKLTSAQSQEIETMLQASKQQREGRSTVVAAPVVVEEPVVKTTTTTSSASSPKKSTVKIAPDNGPSGTIARLKRWLDEANNMGDVDNVIGHIETNISVNQNDPEWNGELKTQLSTLLETAKAKMSQMNKQEESTEQ